MENMDGGEQTPVIVARGVRKTYHTGRITLEALRGVDVAVSAGEMVAVMGPSGCGKTTLLNCLSGLDDIDSGSVTIGSVDLAEMSDNRKTRYRATRMGFIFQHYNLLPVLTAQENVELPLLVSGTGMTEARRKALAALDTVGLSERVKHYPTELSGGEQQRVTIARALVNDPEIVWADEPTGNLDSANASELMELLASLNRENRQTFVIVTHSNEVAALAHRVIRMRDGLIEDSGIAVTQP